MVQENTEKMKKRRKMDKDAFQDELKQLLATGKLPKDYATIIAYLRPEIPKTRIYNVKRVGTVDWDVLNLMKSLAKV